MVLKAGEREDSQNKHKNGRSPAQNGRVGVSESNLDITDEYYACIFKDFNFQFFHFLYFHRDFKFNIFTTTSTKVMLKTSLPCLDFKFTIFTTTPTKVMLKTSLLCFC